jgi:hypothetical protein
MCLLLRRLALLPCVFLRAQARFGGLWVLRVREEREYINTERTKRGGHIDRGRGATERVVSGSMRKTETPYQYRVPSAERSNKR